MLLSTNATVGLCVLRVYSCLYTPLAPLLDMSHFIMHLDVWCINWEVCGCECSYAVCLCIHWPLLSTCLAQLCPDVFLPLISVILLKTSTAVSVVTDVVSTICLPQERNDHMTTCAFTLTCDLTPAQNNVAAAAT